MAALLYELLTGQRALGIIQRPSSLNPNLAPGVDAVLLRGLADDPDDRFPTVGEFAAAMERALARTPDGSRRRVVAVLALTALVGSVASMAASLTVSGRRGLKPHAVRPTGGDRALPSGRAARTLRAPAPVPPSRVNRLGMAFARVPAGQFLMGADDESPPPVPMSGHGTSCGSPPRSSWGRPKSPSASSARSSPRPATLPTRRPAEGG